MVCNFLIQALLITCNNWSARKVWYIWNFFFSYIVCYEKLIRHDNYIYKYICEYIFFWNSLGRNGMIVCNPRNKLKQTCLASMKQLWGEREHWLMHSLIRYFPNYSLQSLHVSAQLLTRRWKKKKKKGQHKCKWSSDEKLRHSRGGYVLKLLNYHETFYY